MLITFQVQLHQCMGLKHIIVKHYWCDMYLELIGLNEEQCFLTNLLATENQTLFLCCNNRDPVWMTHCGKKEAWKW